MNRSASTTGAWRDMDWRHGIRLSIAVVVAFAVSTAFHLPESFWAVMSALIVVRPTAGSTLGAGWDRVRGTITGTVIGLGGVWLHHSGLGSPVSTLVIIAIVAFLSAIVPAMRSAPISALIILTSGGIPGHSALDVAGLRAIEISIGVAIGVVVSLFAFATHARERFSKASADWLRETAEHTVDELTGGAVAAEARDRWRERTRAVLRQIAELAVGADREARWLAKLGRRDVATIDRVACARLMTRISSDVGAVVRAAGCTPTPIDADTRRALGDDLANAMHAIADFITDAPVGRSVSGLRLRASHRSLEAPNDAWIAAPSHLLLQDLQGLRKLHGQGATE